MKNFIVKTTFGNTYEWTPELIAEDWAATAIQWQDEEEFPKTEKQLYDEILSEHEHLESWYNDQIRGDTRLTMDVAKLIGTNEEEKQEFIEWAIRNFGSEV